MSRAITKIKRIWNNLADKDYRDAYLDALIDAQISGQLYALRTQRGWTQDNLAQETGMAQSRIAKLESSSAGISVNTLKRFASAFGVALSIKFVPHSSMVKNSVNENIDSEIVSFDNDMMPVDFYFNGFVQTVNEIISLPVLDDKNHYGYNTIVNGQNIALGNQHAVH